MRPIGQLYRAVPLLLLLAGACNDVSEPATSHEPTSWVTPTGLVTTNPPEIAVGAGDIADCNKPNDEATANLDVRHEMEVFELAADLATRTGLGVLMITHHVNLAARFVNQIVVLNGGRTAAMGTPAQALRQDVLEQVFRWPLQTFDWHGVPQLMPLKKSERHER